MKELVPVAYDDLFFKENGDKVQANETVMLGLNGEWHELDLTQDHSQELHNFLSRYIKAAHKPEGEVKPASNYAFYRGMREFADRSGLQKEYRKIPTGYKYSKKLNEEYRQYLSGIGKK